MRKLALSLAVAALAPAIGPGPAVAQTLDYAIESEMEMTPKKAGTKDRPRGVEIQGRLEARTEPGSALPTITAGRVLLPQGIAYNGHRYPKCSAEAFRRGGADLKSCLRRSIVGSSRVGWVEREMYPMAPDVSFVNGGARRIWAYTRFFIPAFVQEPIAIDVKRLDGPRWSYELSFEVPQNMQVIVGVPIPVRPRIGFEIGGKPNVPRYLTTSGGCPKRGFRPYEVSLDYRFYPDGPAGTSVDRGRLACS